MGTAKFDHPKSQTSAKLIPDDLSLIVEEQTAGTARFCAFFLPKR